jgi:hypothetical protein
VWFSGFEIDALKVFLQGSSNDTIQGVLRYCEKYSPLWICLENVFNIVSACVAVLMGEHVSNFHIIERWFLNLGCAALIVTNCDILLRVLLTLL